MYRSDLDASLLTILLWYARDADTVKYRQLLLRAKLGEQIEYSYDYVELPDGTIGAMTTDEMTDRSCIASRSEAISTESTLTSQTGGECITIPV